MIIEKCHVITICLIHLKMNCCNSNSFDRTLIVSTELKQLINNLRARGSVFVEAVCVVDLLLHDVAREVEHADADRDKRNPEVRKTF